MARHSRLLLACVAVMSLVQGSIGKVCRKRNSKRLCERNKNTCAWNQTAETKCSDLCQAEQFFNTGTNTAAVVKLDCNGMTSTTATTPFVHGEQSFVATLPKGVVNFEISIDTSVYDLDIMILPAGVDPVKDKDGNFPNCLLGYGCAQGSDSGNFTMPDGTIITFSGDGNPDSPSPSVETIAITATTNGDLAVWANFFMSDGKEEENGLARGAIYNGTMTYSYDTIDDCGAALCVACGEYAACPESKRPVCDGTKTIECEDVSCGGQGFFECEPNSDGFCTWVDTATGCVETGSIPTETPTDSPTETPTDSPTETPTPSPVSCPTTDEYFSSDSETGAIQLTMNCGSNAGKVDISLAPGQFKYVATIPSGAVDMEVRIKAEGTDWDLMIMEEGSAAPAAINDVTDKFDKCVIGYKCEHDESGNIKLPSGEGTAKFSGEGDSSGGTGSENTEEWVKIPEVAKAYKVYVHYDPEAPDANGDTDIKHGSITYSYDSIDDCDGSALATKFCSPCNEYDCGERSPRQTCDGTATVKCKTCSMLSKKACKKEKEVCQYDTGEKECVDAFTFVRCATDKFYDPSKSKCFACHRGMNQCPTRHIPLCNGSEEVKCAEVVCSNYKALTPESYGKSECNKVNGCVWRDDQADKCVDVVIPTEAPTDSPTETPTDSPTETPTEKPPCNFFTNQCDEGDGHCASDVTCKDNLVCGENNCEWNDTNQTIDCCKSCGPEQWIDSTGISQNRLEGCQSCPDYTGCDAFERPSCDGTTVVVCEKYTDSPTETPTDSPTETPTEKPPCNFFTNRCDEGDGHCASDVTCKDNLVCGENNCEWNDSNKTIDCCKSCGPEQWIDSTGISQGRLEGCQSCPDYTGCDAFEKPSCDGTTVVVCEEYDCTNFAGNTTCMNHEGCNWRDDVGCVVEGSEPSPLPSPTPTPSPYDSYSSYSSYDSYDSYVTPTPSPSDQCTWTKKCEVGGVCDDDAECKSYNCNDDNICAAPSPSPCDLLSHDDCYTLDACTWEGVDQHTTNCGQIHQPANCDVLAVCAWAPKSNQCTYAAYVCRPKDRPVPTYPCSDFADEETCGGTAEACSWVSTAAGAEDVAACPDVRGKSGCQKKAHCKWQPKRAVCGWGELAEMKCRDTVDPVAPTPSPEPAGPCDNLAQDACTSDECAWLVDTSLKDCDAVKGKAVCLRNDNCKWLPVRGECNWVDGAEMACLEVDADAETCGEIIDGVECGSSALDCSWTGAACVEDTEPTPECYAACPTPPTTCGQLETTECPPSCTAEKKALFSDGLCGQKVCATVAGRHGCLARDYCTWRPVARTCEEKIPAGECYAACPAPTTCAELETMVSDKTCPHSCTAEKKILFTDRLCGEKDCTTLERHGCFARDYCSWRPKARECGAKIEDTETCADSSADADTCAASGLACAWTGTECVPDADTECYATCPTPPTTCAELRTIESDRTCSHSCSLEKKLQFTDALCGDVDCTDLKGKTRCNARDYCSWRNKARKCESNASESKRWLRGSR